MEIWHSERDVDVAGSSAGRPGQGCRGGRELAGIRGGCSHRGSGRPVHPSLREIRPSPRIEKLYADGGRRIGARQAAAHTGKGSRGPGCSQKWEVASDSGQVRRELPDSTQDDRHAVQALEAAVQDLVTSCDRAGRRTRCVARARPLNRDPDFHDRNHCTRAIVAGRPEVNIMATERGSHAGQIP